MYSLKTYIQKNLKNKNLYSLLFSPSWTIQMSQILASVHVFWGDMGCQGIRAKGKADHPPGDVKSSPEGGRRMLLLGSCGEEDIIRNAKHTFSSGVRWPTDRGCLTCSVSAATGPKKLSAIQQTCNPIFKQINVKPLLNSRV